MPIVGITAFYLGSQSSNRTVNPTATPEPTIQPTATPTQSLQPTLTPEPTPTIKEVTLSYTELSREKIDNDTKLTLTVNAQYVSGEIVTLNKENFLVDILVYVSDFAPITGSSGTSNSLDYGVVMVSNSQQTASFNITFQFETMRPTKTGMTGFMEMVGYTLLYSGNQLEITWV